MSSDNVSKSEWNVLAKFINEQMEKHPDHPAISNMGFAPPAGFLHNIQVKSRWTSQIGEIAVLKKNGHLIGVSCVEISDVHTGLSVGGIRFWLDDQHRSTQLASRYLLDSNLRWSKEKGLSGMMLTFNHYNKWIYNGISRAAIGKPVGIGSIWSHWWDDCIPIPVPLLIRYTEQWCVIKPLTTGLEHIIQEIIDHQ